MRTQRCANTCDGVFEERHHLREESGAYLAEYSGIARFHENFHSLGEFPFGKSERREGGGVLSLQKVSGIHYRARLASSSSRRPFQFHAAFFRFKAHLSLSLLLPSSSRPTAAIGRKDRRGDIPDWQEVDARQSETSFGPAHASFDGTPPKNGRPINCGYLYAKRSSCSNKIFC